MRSYRRSKLVVFLLGAVMTVGLSGCARSVSSSQPPVVPQPLTTATPGASLDDIGGFTRPTDLVAPDDGSNRMFVAEEAGTIRVVRDGELLESPALDLSGRVGATGRQDGLIGLAFPPDFAKKGYAYVQFTDKANSSQVYRVGISATDPDVFDPATMQLIMTVQQSPLGNRGGQLAFGPDGYLYVGLGDDGSDDDENPGEGEGTKGTAQDLSTLLGKILRIDTESTPDAPGYRIPKDNPNVGRRGAKPEIWALGLRDPRRFSFDPPSGDLWIGDAGHDRWEEIDRAASGSKRFLNLNFGWPLYEGNDVFKATSKQSGFVWPVFAYTHREGTSVTGGYVYHGSAYPGMQDMYVFGDYGSGSIWTLSRNGSQWTQHRARKTFYKISTFGVDGSGELWLADYAAGRIHRLDDLSR